MKFRIMNVHLAKKKKIGTSENDVTETGFISPLHLGEGVYGWEVTIRSKISNQDRTWMLFVETVSEYQFSAGSDFPDDFNSGRFLEVVSELIYASHCHHASLFAHCASSYKNFGPRIPRFISLHEARDATLEAMRNAKPM